MSTPVKHIIFPTDFSDNASRALPFALETALRFNATLTILHTVQQAYDFTTIGDQIRQTSEEYAHSRLGELEKEVGQQDKYRQLEIRTQVQHGRTVSSIMEVADETGAGLIVMGTKGASGLKRMIFGSVTTEVLLHSRIPVLAIPKCTTPREFEHILFTTDFHDGDIEALQETVGWARSFGARLTVLHIEEEPNLQTNIRFRGFRELAKEVVHYDKLDFEFIQEYSFFSGIAQFLDQHDVSMLVLTRYKKPFFYSIIEQNHSREMGQHTQLPLLILIGKDRPFNWPDPNK